MKTDDNYKEIIWYFPFIDNDRGNKKHLEILYRLYENFDIQYWKIDWAIDESLKPIYNPKKLYIFFKFPEDAMAFKLRWC